MEVVIGIDIGTGSMKAIAFDPANFKVIANHQEFYSTIKKGRTQEQNPETIFDAFVKTTNIIQQKLVGQQSIALVFSSAMHSIIAMDQHDQPLTNCILWSDSRSFEQAQSLKKEPIATDIYEKTGTPIHAMSPLTKIVYFRENQKKVFENARKYISIKSYILFQLYGTYYEDYSLASASGLFDLKERNWYDKAIDYARINTNQLPEPVDTNFILANLPEEKRRLLNLPAEIPIIIGGGDGPLANLGALSIGDAEGCITFGTSGAIRIASKNQMVDKSKSIFTYILDDEYYVSGGATNNGGIVLKWLATAFLSQPNEQTDIEEVIKFLDEIEAGSEGLICLPWILGERAPVWDAKAKGMFIGINHQHTKGHFVRAGIEGVLYNAKIILDILESLAAPVPTINFNGGMAKSQSIAQLLADIFEKNISVSSFTDASTMGAIYLAIKALGIIKSYDELTKYKPKESMIYPRANFCSVHQENFKLYRKMVDHYTMFLS